MTRETELNLLVPSPELLVVLASGDKPLGVPAGPPHIRTIRETYFDTADETLSRRGMTCKLRQMEESEPSVVVTLGEGPDSEGITSRSRLTTSSVGFGVFETLRGESEAAAQIQKVVEPSLLRPQIALDIQRLGRVFRSGIFRRPTLMLLFDRIAVQVGGHSTVFHELRIRRHRKGGPLIRDLAQPLKDVHHLFPDGLSTLQRAHRLLSMEGKAADAGLSPYAMSLALAWFSAEGLGLQQKGAELCIPTFRGSGEDAARALTSDLTGSVDVELLRLGATEQREGREVIELWSVPSTALQGEVPPKAGDLTWYPWHLLLERVGQPSLRNPTLTSALLLLTRRRLLGQLPWLLGYVGPKTPSSFDTSLPAPEAQSDLPEELRPAQALLPLLRTAENSSEPLRARLQAASEISSKMGSIFLSEVKRTKERILSNDTDQEDQAPIQLLDLISIRIRGVMDRLYQVLDEDLLPALEASGVYLRSWNGLMQEDRRGILEHFTSSYLSSMAGAQEWGPAFIPDMPPEGCAIGVLARAPGEERTRFFHLVLAGETPSFVHLPGSSEVLPLEEVVRGYLFSLHPELERCETYLFRFTTGEVTVRELIPQPDEAEEPGTLEEEQEVEVAESSGPEPTQGMHLDPALDVLQNPAAEIPAEAAPDPALEPAPDVLGDPASALPPVYSETQESVVVRVLVRKRMPETSQAQLLRALERQVTRRNPLIGWSDLYPIKGPLDLTGLDGLLDLVEE